MPNLQRSILIVLLLVLVALPVSAQPAVTAEAVGQANLRATVGTDAPIIGQIVAGTRYPVLARSEFYPWLLLGDPASGTPIGWVFQDLLSVQGDVFAVPISSITVDGTLVSTPVAPSAGVTLPASAAAPTLTLALPTATLGAQIVGTVLGEINIRYGPGVEYPRLGVGRVGDAYEVTQWHTQLPWVQIRYDAAPNGYGWVQADLLEYNGDYFSLPSTGQLRFNLPTLTPTPSAIESATGLDGEVVPLSPSFAALGDQLWSLMLGAGFDPATSRLGTLYLLDLQTGEAIAFGSEIAFSGMSLSKISILTALYGELDTVPDDTQAFEIGESMVCSENTSTNDILAIIGGGSPYSGARMVSTRLQGLGMENTFIAAPYTPDARITPEPVTLPTTNADQIRAEPDPANQMTVDELGGLLGSVYDCAVSEDGALLATYPDDYTPAECRQIINTMSSNRINALIEMGVPEGTVIAHKHGWVDDTHGDAGIVFTPGGDYVLVAAVHNPIWMNFEESFPLIAEISRAVYNYYNPDAPMTAIRVGEVNDVCEMFGNPLIAQILAGDVALPVGN